MCIDEWLSRYSDVCVRHGVIRVYVMHAETTSHVHLMVSCNKLCLVTRYATRMYDNPLIGIPDSYE